MPNNGGCCGFGSRGPETPDILSAHPVDAKLARYECPNLEGAAVCCCCGAMEGNANAMKQTHMAHGDSHGSRSSCAAPPTTTGKTRCSGARFRGTTTRAPQAKRHTSIQPRRAPPRHSILVMMR